MTVPPRPSTANRMPAKDVRRELFLKKNKSYAALPSLQQWQVDTKPGRIGGRANDPVLRNIDTLIKELQTARGGAYPYFAGQLFFSTMFWMNHQKKDPRMIDQCRGPILSLNLFAANDLARVLRCPLNDLASKLQQLYGVNMSEHGVATDAKEQPNYLNGARREQYRVFIISGRACHYRRTNKQFKIINTTVAKGELEGFNDERPGLGFVLSMSNELYAGLLGKLSLGYHSQFMAGRPVMCAGTMVFDQGRVTYIRNDSGHYKPVDHSMIKVLHYLQMNGMPIRDITIGREQVASGLAEGRVEVSASEFMLNNGNWNAILARASHQRKL